MSAEHPRTAGVYERLGVSRVINAADTYTALGGGRWSPAVAESVVEASSHHVQISDLIERAGAHIAEGIGVPAALPLAGAAAGLTVAAAACLSGPSPAMAARLPGSPPARREFLMLKSQRTGYDAAFAQAGGVVRDIGSADAPPAWDLVAEADERTAAYVWLAGTEFERRAPTLEMLAIAAREASVPLIVDAAAQVPPYERLADYHRHGANLVAISGGKGLRAPQASGLLVGDADLIAAARLNAFPNHSVGRPMKLSKEIVIGLVTAVDEALAFDAAGADAEWTSLLDRIDAALPQGLSSWQVPTGRMGQHCPRLYIGWSAPTVTAHQVAADFLDRDVPVAIGVDQDTAQEIFINPFSVLAEEQNYLVEAVEEVLSGRFS